MFNITTRIFHPDLEFLYFCLFLFYYFLFYLFVFMRFEIFFSLHRLGMVNIFIFCSKKSLLVLRCLGLVRYCFSFQIVFKVSWFAFIQIPFVFWECFVISMFYFVKSCFVWVASLCPLTIYYHNICFRGFLWIFL